MITPLDALEQLEAWREGRAATRTTGFAELDDVTGGFEPGQVWIVAGTPGQGRSTLASQWALLLAGDHGFDTHLVSKRDPTRKVAARLVASTAKVPELHLWHGPMSAQDAGRLSHAKQTLAAARLQIIDPGGISIVDTDMDEVPRPEALVVDDADLAGGLFPSRVASLAASGILLVLTLPRATSYQPLGWIQHGRASRTSSSTSIGRTSSTMPRSGRERPTSTCCATAGVPCAASASSIRVTTRGSSTRWHHLIVSASRPTVERWTSSHRSDGPGTMRRATQRRQQETG